MDSISVKTDIQVKGRDSETDSKVSSWFMLKKAPK